MKYPAALQMNAAIRYWKTNYLQAEKPINLTGMRDWPDAPVWFVSKQHQAKQSHLFLSDK